LSLLRVAGAFLNYLNWRHRKDPQMFTRHAGMTMEERDPLVAEWANTIRTEEASTRRSAKHLTFHPLAQDSY
jgi:hypothetical protein